MRVVIFAFLLIIGTKAWGTDPLPQLLKKAVDIPVYELSEKEWLLFPFSNPTFEARIATHADISKKTPWNPEERWSYKIEVEILSLSGEIVEKRELSYHSQVLYYSSPKFGQYTPYFYAKGDVVPTLTKLSVLNWSDKNRGVYARVRLLEKNENITGVYCRMYEKPYILLQNLLSFWYRLDPESQLRLAEGNIFDLSFLSLDEKENLIRNMWVHILD